jgi:SAM-dependent methyltransferase
MTLLKKHSNHTGGHGTDVTDSYRDGTYLQKNNTWHAEDSLWKARQIIELGRRNKFPFVSVGEVGCGAGEILRQLAEQFPTSAFTGYEMSPQAFGLCKAREHERVKYENRSILDEDVWFDCLLCIDVFEHVEDYMAFLRALRTKAEYKIFHIPLDLSVLSVLRSSMMTARLSVGHLHYFSAETALATLRDSGYTIVDHFYTRPFEHFPGKSTAGKLASLLRKILYTVSPHWTVRLVGGCSLIVLAR